MTTIPIIYATDLNYARYMLVSMYSLMCNASKDYAYRFIILVSQSEDVSKMDFVKEKMAVFDNCNVEFLNAETTFDDLDLEVERLSSATFYRLCLPDLLPDVDKCLYLDGDTAVVGDIADLWNEDIGDDLLGGVEGHNFTTREKKNRNRLDWPEDKPFKYINAGILSFNLREMRLKDTTAAFRAIKDREFHFADQDMINMVCADHMRYLPCRYNIRPYYTGWYAEITEREEIQKQIEDALSNPAVYHYASAHKPWKDVETPFAEAWLKYAMSDDLAELFEDVRALQNDPERQAYITEARERRVSEIRTRSEMRQLRKEIIKLEKENEKLERKVARVKEKSLNRKKTIEDQKREIERLNGKIERIESSGSYKFAKKLSNVKKVIHG